MCNRLKQAHHESGYPDNHETHDLTRCLVSLAIRKGQLQIRDTVPHPPTRLNLKKILTKSGAGEDVEQMELSHTSGSSIKAVALDSNWWVSVKAEHLLCGPAFMS